MALLSGDGWLFLLRWFHFLAGITWIGMLYYFNFVQTPFFGSKFVADNTAVRSGIVRGGLLNTALWGFRWGAVFTLITGWLYILHTPLRQDAGGVRSPLSPRCSAPPRSPRWPVRRPLPPAPRRSWRRSRARSGRASSSRSSSTSCSPASS